MQNKSKIFIIAGEVSGDVLGARIMSEMPDVEFYGIEHFYTIWQNAKVLLANRALFYPLKSL